MGSSPKERGMSLGTLGWGHTSLAKNLGGKARKGGCGKVEIRRGPEGKSYSGAGLVSGLGRGLHPETWRVDHGTGHGNGQETKCKRKKLKGVGLKALCWDRKETEEHAPTQACSSFQSWNGTPEDCVLTLTLSATTFQTCSSRQDARPCFHLLSCLRIWLNWSRITFLGRVKSGR